MVQFGGVFEILKLTVKQSYQTGQFFTKFLPLKIGQKLVENAKIQNIQMRHFE